MADPMTTDKTEQTRPLILWLIPAVVVVGFPGLWWTWSDAHYPLRTDLLAVMTVIVAVVAVAVFAALSGGFRQRIRWSLGMTAAILATGFQWPAFTSAGRQVVEITGVGLLGDVVPVVFAGALIWFAARLAGDRYFATGASVLAVVVLLVLGSSALSVGSTDSEPAALAGTAGPDVLLLVLDGYGRTDWLEAEYGFDNSGFESELEARGFVVAAEATANYARTHAALSTMLNLDYVFDAGDSDADEWNRMRAVLTGQAGLIAEFKAAGYETVLFENAWSGSQCGPAIDRCIRDGLVERGVWNLSQMTILSPLIREARPDPFNSVSFDHLLSLGDVVAAPGTADQPRLVVAHILLPHPPALLNADCTRVPHDDLRSWGSDPGKLDGRRHNYGEQAKCVNRHALEAIDRLIARDHNAVVMITGDHGPGSTLDWNLPPEELADETILERMTILSSYRLPGCAASVRPDLTPVNGARIATDCALGTDLGEIPDRHYWTRAMSDPIVPVESVFEAKDSP